MIEVQSLWTKHYILNEILVPGKILFNYFRDRLATSTVKAWFGTRNVIAR